MEKSASHQKKLIAHHLNFKKRILIVLSAALLAPVLASMPANAVDDRINFGTLNQFKGNYLLFGDMTTKFFACWDLRQRTYLYAREPQKTTWTPVASAFILKDTTGTCDIDFPYLHQYTWRPIAPNGHTLMLGIGTSSSPSDLTVRKVEVYARLAELSCLGAKKSRNCP